MFGRVNHFVVAVVVLLLTDALEVSILGADHVALVDKRTFNWPLQLVLRVKFEIHLLRFTGQLKLQLLRVDFTFLGRSLPVACFLLCLFSLSLHDFLVL